MTNAISEETTLMLMHNRSLRTAEVRGRRACRAFLITNRQRRRKRKPRDSTKIPTLLLHGNTGKLITFRPTPCINYRCRLRINFIRTRRTLRPYLSHGGACRVLVIPNASYVASSKPSAYMHVQSFDRYRDQYFRMRVLVATSLYSDAFRWQIDRGSSSGTSIDASGRWGQLKKLVPFEAPSHRPRCTDVAGMRLSFGYEHPHPTTTKTLVFQTVNPKATSGPIASLSITA